MAKNEFLPFGIGAEANVLTPADWSTLPARSKGFAAGAAKSKELNTAWRQSSVISSVVAQFIADSSGKDVLDNGDTATLLSALKNLLTPTGVPHPWPTATPPTGWLKCNGATFSKTLYPNLALAYPSGVLPDLRGEFIRGWDDGRGVDAGRALLSSQVGSKLRQCASTTTPSGGNGSNIWDNLEFDQKETVTLYSTPTNATGLPFLTGIVRPRNIAFNYIVRAA